MEISATGPVLFCPGYTGDGGNLDKIQAMEWSLFEKSSLISGEISGFTHIVIEKTMELFFRAIH